jgi:hypothetical protein
MIAGLRLVTGTMKVDGSARNSEAEDTDPQSGGKNDGLFCLTVLMAVFEVMDALNIAGEAKIELLSQLPISMRITACNARK